MRYFLRPIFRKCANLYCERQATVTLLDESGKRLGDYCRVCGKDKAKLFARMDARREKAAQKEAAHAS